MNLYLLLAQTGQNGQPPAGGGAGGLGGLFSLAIPFAVIFLIFYLLLIRPQKKQEKARQEMLKALKKNDKVVTIGGIHGVVANVRDSDVTLKVDESGNVRMRFSRSAISRILSRDEDGSDSEGGS